MEEKISLQRALLTAHVFRAALLTVSGSPDTLSPVLESLICQRLLSTNAKLGPLRYTVYLEIFMELNFHSLTIAN